MFSSSKITNALCAIIIFSSLIPFKFAYNEDPHATLAVLTYMIMLLLTAICCNVTKIAYRACSCSKEVEKNK